MNVVVGKGAETIRTPVRPPRRGSVDLGELYDAHLGFVWRGLRRMGVHAFVMDDAVQDVYLVAYRRLPEFKAQSQIKTWLYGIVLRVAHNYRRAARRLDARVRQADPVEIEATADKQAEGPHEIAVRHEATTLLYELVERLDNDKRSIFVLVELEGLTVGGAAEALGINVNTAYSRLRAARIALDEAVARYGNK